MSSGLQLKDFQQATVDYVLKRFYGPDPTDRFLVADEVGMGKTMVARGVIAGAIEHCKADPKISRIDVLYICSNAEIARQNLAKLTVRGATSKPFNTRITLLASGLNDLDREPPPGEKTVNFISFTPGTSFDQGHKGGRVDERALLYVMLKPLFHGLKRRRTLERLLRLGVADATWLWALERIGGEVELRRSPIAETFRRSLKSSESRQDLLNLVNRIVARRGHISDALAKESRRVIGDLRQLLAIAGVDHLEPDLVILDEFQRFKHLLESPEGDEEMEVSSLAHQLFDYEDAKILLLSATPYRGFTFSEERRLTGDDHYEDFFLTLDFLFRSREQAQQVRVLLAEFRGALVRGVDASAALGEVQGRLRGVMSRIERPVLEDYDMLDIRSNDVLPPTSADMAGFVALHRMAGELDAQLSIEYWKSVPYFLNFMDGYQLGARIRREPEVARRHGALAQALSRRSIRRRESIDHGNARLRALYERTVGTELWKLLWIPPSMPYTEPGPVFRGFEDNPPTKRLIFSSWAAAPTAIASLLSYDAERAMMPEAPSSRTQRFVYRTRAGRASTMTTFALFCPLPDLASECDPLEAARQAPRGPVPLPAVERETAVKMEDLLPEPGASASRLSADTWYWAAPFQIGLGRWSDRLRGLESLFADEPELDNEESEELFPEKEPDRRGVRSLTRHIDRALSVVEGNEELGPHPDDLSEWIARIGLFSPGNVAWRAIRATTAGIEGIDDDIRFDAAAIIAEGFRSLFNRADVMSLIDRLYESAAPGPASDAGDPYWQSVLRYCADGNLQAVMDEYLHHKIENENISDAAGGDDTPGVRLMDLAGRVRDSISVQAAPLSAFDPMVAGPGGSIDFTPRFAIRYGSARGEAKTDERAVARLSGVKEAFNSPFWPFVLASTSVGQEGLDFHWWCHSIVHWNIPANPVDFEQREGRIHRYKGHAIRKNVAERHRLEALQSLAVDPWQAAFEAASTSGPPELGELWPCWVYPGSAKVQRWIPAFPQSRDEGRIEEMQVLRALYRLCFGQPRQEDLIELLRQSDVDGSSELGLCFDLRPPKLGTISPVRRK